MASILGALFKDSSDTNHEEIVEACDALLEKSKDDAEVQHVKVVALLKLDLFEAALRVFERGGETLKSYAQLEYAYTLYKSGKLEEARDVAHSLEQRGAKHVEAQAVSCPS